MRQVLRHPSEADFLAMYFEELALYHQTERARIERQQHSPATSRDTLVENLDDPDNDFDSPDYPWLEDEENES